MANNKKLNEPFDTEFAYDRVFGAMQSECEDALLLLANYVFKEDYDRSAVTIRMQNEHYIVHEDGSADKRITDSHFTTSKGDVGAYYL